METNSVDTLQIRDLIERWVIYRDSLLWDQFRTIWHPEGIMTATWTSGSFEHFIEITKKGVEKGLNIMHLLGSSAIEVNGNRAVSLTRVMIQQRAELHGVLCDVTCYARHYDLWEKWGEQQEKKWGLLCRDTIADKDRCDPVDNSENVKLDKTILDQFPIEYQHLAYLQTMAGYNVNKDCPRLSGGAALDALYKKGEEWLIR